LGIEKAGIPVVNITAITSVSKVVGISRILQGLSVSNVLGNEKMSKDKERSLRKSYVLRALDILQEGIDKQHVFTLEGKEE
jgi:glycine/betaine/sarcosine/D-proline reductase family selenoprotein B